MFEHTFYTVGVVMHAQQASERIRAALDAIDAAHHMLRATPSDVVGNAFRVEVAERLEAQGRTNRGLMYRIFGEIGDPPDEAGCAPVVRGMLSARLRLTPNEVTRRLRLAARIRPRRTLTGAPLEPELPALAAAVAAGTVGEDHIRAVCAAVDSLPSCVGPADAAGAERTLVAHAAKLDAAVVAKLGQRIADYLNPDGRFTDVDRARRRGLCLGGQGPDGMSRLSGLLDPEARAYFEALVAAVRPGRHQGPDSDPEARDERTPAQRCHDALKLGLEAAIASGGTGVHRGHPVTVIATTTLGELDRAARALADSSVPMPAPARTGGGSRLPMPDLIRMAAKAIHYLAVFDEHTGRPLYLGRQKRIATADQRIICYARDRGCTRPNCLEPGYHCEVHHAPDWAGGGRTDADKLFFACGPDHGAVSRGEWRTEVTGNGRLGWTDGSALGDGPPEINRAHHPDELLRGDPDPPEGD